MESRRLRRPPVNGGRGVFSTRRVSPASGSNPYARGLLFFRRVKRRTSREHDLPSRRRTSRHFDRPPCHFDRSGEIWRARLPTTRHPYPHTPVLSQPSPRQSSVQGPQLHPHPGPNLRRMSRTPFSIPRSVRDNSPRISQIPMKIKNTNPAHSTMSDNHWPEAGPSFIEVQADSQLTVYPTKTMMSKPRDKKSAVRIA